MKKVHITTMGCSKNIVDSEILGGQLEHNQFELTENPELADVIIINTCGFIKEAKEESIQAIMEAVELKQADPKKEVIVAGCLSQRYKNELAAEIPEVDDVFGTEDFSAIVKKLKGNHAAVDNWHRLRKLTTPGHFAYLKISEGCNHTCAFCAIPGIRGKHRSRSMESLVEEAKMIAERGVKELILISQDTSYYGIDLYGKQKIIPLLEQLDRIDGLEWIRLMYWYPTNFPMDVLNLMSSGSKIVPYIDMPLQHISNKMLRLMRRGDTSESIRKKLYHIREHFPQINLRTTMILGHPGEEDADFEDLHSFVNEIRFNRLGTFLYSDEEGTPAMNFENKVETSIARKRQEIIMESQRIISLNHNQKLMGSILPVIIDERNEKNNYYIGRTIYDAPEIDNEVIISGSGTDSGKSGSICEVKITETSDYELYGEFSN